jgi:hypothetical protein
MELTSAQACAPTQYIEVSQSSEECKRVEAELGRIGCSLVKLERMQNVMQESLYATLKRALSAEVKVEGGMLNEQSWLFHGTSSVHAVEGIARCGFDNRYFSLEGKFGPGIYLADELAKSHAYTKCIAEMDWCRVVYVCKAVLGKMEELSDKKDRVMRSGPRPGFQSVHWNGYGKRKPLGCKPSQSGYYDEYILYRYGQAVPYLKITYKEDRDTIGGKNFDETLSPAAALAIIRLMLDALKTFSTQKCDLFRDLAALLKQCEELVNMMAEQGVVRLHTLALLGDELLMGVSLLEKWRSKFSGVLRIVQSKARLSRISDLVASVKTYRDEMMQILQRKVEERSLGLSNEMSESSLSILSSVRRGGFDKYTCVKNENARQFWVKFFPGRQEVSWGEFRNSVSTLKFMQQTDDFARCRAFYWLKLELGISEGQGVLIGQWGKLTEKSADFKDTFVSWFNLPVPGEDDVDISGTISSRAGPRPSAPPLSFRVTCAVSEDNIESVAQQMGILVAQPPVGVSSVDVAFLVDCTGTMRKHIDSLKVHLPVLVKQVKSSALGCLVRLAFVGYRDIGDVEQFTVLPFTTNVQEVVDFLNRTEASGGGGDAAEDVMGGLEIATKLEWTCGSKTVRRLVHIGDAPSHGTRYHKFAERTKSPSWIEAQNKWDRFPNTDLDGSQGQSIMSVLARKKIDYTFVELVPFTQTMTRQFLHWYNSFPENVVPMQVIPLLDLNGLATLLSDQVALTLKNVPYLLPPIIEFL